MFLNPFKRIAVLEANLSALQADYADLRRLVANLTHDRKDIKLPVVSEDDAKRLKQREYKRAWAARKKAKAEQEAQQQRKREYQRAWMARKRAEALAAKAAAAEAAGVAK